MIFRLEGIGVYTFPTGTGYEGELKDGMFHGTGTLFFKNGSRYEATWENGIVVEVMYWIYVPGNFTLNMSRLLCSDTNWFINLGTRAAEHQDSGACK